LTKDTQLEKLNLVILKYPPYFINSNSWAKFWLSANPKNHNYHLVEVTNFAGIVYEYPWYLGNNFLYLSKGPVLKTNSKNLESGELLLEFKNFLNKITELGKINNSTFIKIDFDDELLRLLGVEKNYDLEDFLQKNFDFKFKLPTKTIQYISTMTLDLGEFQNQELSDDLQEFFQETKSFWAKTNENIRRYTKKSLAQNWKISTEKTQENFWLYWQIYSETSLRQGFATQPKEYLGKLFKEEFSRIIIISDESGPQCVWLGIISENTLTYLSGGNTPKSLTKYGQYLTHLMAVKTAIVEKCNFYDLGGYDSGKGFGKFKEGYRGEIRNFLGPVDILIQPIKYTLINQFLGFFRKILGKHE